MQACSFGLPGLNASLGTRFGFFGKHSLSATLFSVFLRIQENTMAKPFEVCQLPYPKPGSLKSPCLLIDHKIVLEELGQPILMS